MQSEAIFLVKKGASRDAFEKRNILLPELKAGEVLIKSEAFGLNYADAMACIVMPLQCLVSLDTKSWAKL